MRSQVTWKCKKKSKIIHMDTQNINTWNSKVKLI